MANDVGQAHDLEIARTTSIADPATIDVIARAELDTLIQTARRYPRSWAAVKRRITDLATLDEAAADECIYALPRGGKSIEGPSIRFAEALAQATGNCRVAARTLSVNRAEKYVEAEGYFLDAETNVATLASVRRRIVDSKGRLYNEDMIIVTSNAAQSIARRNAILAGVPKAVWVGAYNAAHQILKGDIETLANRREAALKSFARFGLTPDQMLKVMGLKGVEDIGLDQIVPLRGMYSALVNGEITAEDLKRQIEPERVRVTATAAGTAAAATPFAGQMPTADGPAAAGRAAPAAAAAGANGGVGGNGAATAPAQATPPANTAAEAGTPAGAAGQGEGVGAGGMSPISEAAAPSPDTAELNDGDIIARDFILLLGKAATAAAASALIVENAGGFGVLDDAQRARVDQAIHDRLIALKGKAGGA